MKNCIFKIFLYYKIEKIYLISSFIMKLKNKFEKKVVFEYMFMFIEIDYFFKN